MFITSYINAFLNDTYKPSTHFVVLMDRNFSILSLCIFCKSNFNPSFYIFLVVHIVQDATVVASVWLNEIAKKNNVVHYVSRKVIHHFDHNFKSCYKC